MILICLHLKQLLVGNIRPHQVRRELAWKPTTGVNDLNVPVKETSVGQNVNSVQNCQ